MPQRTNSEGQLSTQHWSQKEGYSLYLYSVDEEAEYFTGEERTGFYLISRNSDDIYFVDNEELPVSGPVISPLLCGIKNKNLLSRYMKKVDTESVPIIVLDYARSDVPKDYSLEEILDERDYEQRSAFYGRWAHITNIENGILVPTENRDNLEKLSIREMNFIAGTAGLILHTHWEWGAFIGYQMNDPLEWHEQVDVASHYWVNHILIVCGVITKAIIDNGYPKLSPNDNWFVANMFMKNPSHVKLISSLSSLTCKLSSYEYDCCEEWKTIDEPYVLPHPVAEVINEETVIREVVPFYLADINLEDQLSVLDILYNSSAIRYIDDIELEALEWLDEKEVGLTNIKFSAFQCIDKNGESQSYRFYNSFSLNKDECQDAILDRLANMKGWEILLLLNNPHKEGLSGTGEYTLEHDFIQRFINVLGHGYGPNGADPEKVDVNSEKVMSLDLLNSGAEELGEWPLTNFDTDLVDPLVMGNNVFPVTIGDNTFNDEWALGVYITDNYKSLEEVEFLVESLGENLYDKLNKKLSEDGKDIDKIIESIRNQLSHYVGREFGFEDLQGQIRFVLEGNLETPLSTSIVSDRVGDVIKTAFRLREHKFNEGGDS